MTEFLNTGSGERINSPRRIYMDNAATSFPKPPQVLEAMVRHAREVGASAGRGAYAEARESGRIIQQCRKRLNQLFHGERPEQFVFTLNCSDALNLGIQGMLRPGDHAITTWMDHNSVLRPLNALAGAGIITQTRVAVDGESCVVDPDEIKKAIMPNTRLIAVVHASNVTGAVQPIREIGKIAREAGITFLVDAAQSAGHVPIDLQADGIDLLAFPGHKGLLGPLGTGSLYIRPGLEKVLRPLRYGGTGSVSEQDVQPDFMPDRFESGSHNTIGIAGLSAGLEWILERGVNSLWQHDMELSGAFMQNLAGVQGVQYFGPKTARQRVGNFSVRVDGFEPYDLARDLEEQFGILTRPGLHCAPLAHQTIGTDPAARGNSKNAGTTRFSFGAFLTVEDVRYAAAALARVAETKSHHDPLRPMVHAGTPAQTAR